jgi:hypothetical protein
MAGPTRLPPIDECAADPSFVRFREGLLAAAGKHDVNGLMDALDEGVQIDFGGGQGKQAFRQKWFAVDADKDKIWSELTDALRLGAQSGTGSPLHRHSPLSWIQTRTFMRLSWQNAVRSCAATMPRQGRC